MFNIVLYEPEIPPNTGNIIRLCANTGTQLHLIHPLGFTLEDRQLRRAGLDYDEYTQVTEHTSFDEYIETQRPSAMYAVSTKGKCQYTNIHYQPNLSLVFGPETRGLPDEILARFSHENILKIPMVSGSRSLNLSNAVAVIVYEGLRQNKFKF
jgi:tRNA (cytidine/uridine-2'-O-)-methyltransferase